MILGYHGGDVLFKMESCYFRMTELDLWNQNQLCIHAFMRNSATAIAPKCDYLEN